jgi:ABC-type hemin transport system ATPase subunit
MPISATNLGFRYPRSAGATHNEVLHGVTCSIEGGSLTAIVGPNGSGKSTLIRLLAGLRTPKSGVVTLEGNDLSKVSPKIRARSIGFIEQRPNLAFDFSVKRVIGFGLLARGLNEDAVAIDKAISRFDLEQVASKPYAHLSVGQQQRVSFARAWVQVVDQQGAYLLADEPCSAMDPKHTQLTMNAMKELSLNGIGVGVVIHDLTSAARWSDHAIVLTDDGRLLGHGSSDEVLTQKTLTEVFDVPIERHRVGGRDGSGFEVLVPSLEPIKHIDAPLGSIDDILKT